MALLGTCILNACYQAKTPDQVAKDTAAAENTAAETTAKIEQSAGDKVNNAQTVVSDEKTAEAHTKAGRERAGGGRQGRRQSQSCAGAM